MEPEAAASVEHMLSIHLSNKVKGEQVEGENENIPRGEGITTREEKGEQAFKDDEINIITTSWTSNNKWYL